MSEQLSHWQSVNGIQSPLPEVLKSEIKCKSVVFTLICSILSPRTRGLVSAFVFDKEFEALQCVTLEKGVCRER